MIVSPPILPEPQPPETDAQFVARAMPGAAAGDGGFPVSFDLNWHGGVHLTSPPGPRVRGVVTALPVRAIADGTVAFVRPPTRMSADLEHPLRYRGKWTDDGCVVIRHETETGVNPANGQATTVVFFSIYMHIGAIGAHVMKDQAVFRTDPLGIAGRISGAANRIHFEIVCDDANVQRLTSRSDIGPDTRVPATASHLRGMHYAPGPTGWVSLNAPRVRRFSDADVPHRDNGWMLVDGSSSPGSRCNEPAVLELLESNNDWSVLPAEATRFLNDPHRQLRLSRKICKHHTEWDATNFDARYGWIKTDPNVRATGAEFVRLKAHAAALAFWPQAALGLDAVHWHFHPRLFIQHFRSCAWRAVG